VESTPWYHKNNFVKIFHTNQCLFQLSNRRYFVKSFNVLFKAYNGAQLELGSKIKKMNPLKNV
jgi:hypothetical protein